MLAGIEGFPSTVVIRQNKALTVLYKSPVQTVLSYCFEVFFFFLRKKTMPMLYIKKNQGPAKRKKQCPVEHAPPRQIKEKNV